jgi:hypothetical protein
MEAAHEVHGAAASAVPAAGSAAGNELLTPEGEAAVAATAGCDPNLDFVDEQLICG